MKTLFPNLWQRLLSIATLVFLLSLTVNSHAQCGGDVTINSEGFESGTGIWTIGGADAFRSTNNPNSGSYSMDLQDNAGVASSITTGSTDLTSYSQITVNFSYFPVSMDNSNEDFWLQISTDGGSSYTTVEEWNKDDEFVNDVRYNDAVVISGPFTTTTRLRFRCDASGNADDIYLDDIVICGTLAGGPCSGGISSFPYTEGFESGLGAWSQSSGDDFDWTNLSGVTPSSGTGPAAASEGSYYMYTEASGSNSPSKVAIMNGPCIDLTSASAPFFDFDYHMTGTSVGTLLFDVSTNSGGSWTTLWSRTGDQGTAWQSTSVDLSSYNGQNLNLRFHGTTGSSWSSDLCVDNIVLSDAVNTAPNAVADLASTPNDPITIDVLSNDSDPDGHAITLTAVTVPPNNGGSAVINNNGTPGDPTDDFIDYTPLGTYFGAETFTYQICDNGSPSLCSTAVVTVSVSPNTAPTAVIDSDNTNVATSIAVDVLSNDSDADGHAITLTAITVAPNHGGTAVINNNGTAGDPTDDYIDFTPSGSYTGVETFTYSICDNGNPTLCTSAVVSITITPCASGGPAATEPTFAYGSEWKYEDSGSDLGTAWTGIAYSDVCWSFGNAELGFGDGDETTVINNHGGATYYFRKHFTVADRTEINNMMLGLKRDDGAVVYINGIEIYRSNMPTGSIAYTTLASSDQSGADESTPHTVLVPAAMLVNGDNVVAIEVHQDLVSSSDITFDMEMSHTTVSLTDVLIASGRNWNYNDNGVDLGTAWKNAAIQETADEWEANVTEMGYGDGDEATVLSYGADPNNKYPTYYFRHYFAVNTFNPADSLLLKVRKDDGVIVYLNGNEIFRHGLPTGTVTYSTYANHTASGTDEAIFYLLKIPVTHLNTGSNVLAAEVHQVNATSSDMSFEAELHLVSSVITCDATQNIEPTPNFNFGALWRYNDNGSDLGVAWKQPAYVDTCWSKGFGELGFGDSGESTTLNNHGGISYYFRKYFNVADVTAINNLLLSMVRDDGLVVYVNGTEVYRENMPFGAINYLTEASSKTNDAEETTPHSVVIPSSVLTNGTNLIAVEVHQDGPTSSDIHFDMSMTADMIDHSGGVLVASESSWNFNDNGTDLGTTWRNTSIREVNNNWDAGDAQLGYGQGDEATVIDYGGDAANKYPTYYFRQYFSVYDYEAYDSLWIKLQKDDGAIVYLNNVEIMRHNMPSGPVGYSTYSAGNELYPDSFYTASWPAAILNSGTNVIAVEVHQVNATSSDLSFDLQLELHDGDPGAFVVEYDNISGKVYLDVDVSRDFTSDDFGAGAIGVWAYQDLDGDGDIDEGKDPRLFSDLTNPDGTYDVEVYKPTVQSRKSDVSQSSDDAIELNLGAMNLTTNTFRSIDFSFPPSMVFDTLDSWKYYDAGGIADTTWREVGYDDNSWSSGNGVLGFGDPVTTTLTSGETTYYFRKKINLPTGAEDNNTVRLRMIYDDGAVVYINGREVYRVNMPDGEITPSTYADVTVSAADELVYNTIDIVDPGFITGTNIIAVEIHQVNGTSSDVTFDMSLARATSMISDVGLRFPSVNLPKQAMIVDAHIRMYSASTTENTITVQVEGQKTGDAGTFKASSGDITSRPRTTAMTAWNNTLPLVENQEFQIDGLAEIVQEIVDQGTWAPGNGMAFFISGFKQDFYSSDGGYAPELTISYADTTQTTIKYVMGIDNEDMPSSFSYISDGTPSVTITQSGRAASNVNIGYIGSTSMCVATSDDAYDGFHVINRFSGKNKFIGSTGNSMEIEAIALSANTDTLYAVDADEFGFIDLATGGFTPLGGTIGTANGAAGAINLNDVDGLAWDLTRDLMWATHRRTTPAYDLIFQLDISTGKFIPDAFGAGVDYVVLAGGGSLPDLDDIAVNPNTGNLFAMNNDNGAITNLIEVDVGTGSVTTINNTGLNDMEGQSFHNDGLFYSTSGRVGIPTNSFYQVDTASVSLTFIGFFQSEGDFEGCDCKTGPIVNFIDGLVFEDIDENGVFNPGDILNDSVTVYIYEDVDGDSIVGRRADPLITTAITDSRGYWVAGIFQQGNFIATLDTSNLDLIEFTTDSIHNIRFNINGSVNLGNNFGYRQRNNNLLPIDLIEFDGERAGKRNRLHWATASEVNNNYFDLQRSTDGIHFESIGIIQGAGTTIDKSNYEFFDEIPAKGSNYYRLKQVDFDETADFSGTVHLKLESSAFPEIQVFPNPTKGPLLIRLSESVEEALTVRIYSMNGTDIETSTILAGDDEVALDLSQLSKGIYMVEMWNSSYQFNLKVILR